MRYRSVLIVGVVLLAAGCSWPMAAQGPDRRAWGRNDTTVTAANAATLVKGWTGSVTSAAAEVVGDRDLLVVRDGTNVSGLDPKTGAVLWSRYLPGTGTPGVRGDGLYLPASDTLCSIVQADRGSGTTTGRIDFGTTPGVGATSTCEVGDIVIDGDTVIVPWRQRISKQGQCGLNITARSGLTAYSPDFSTLWFDSSSVAVCDRPPVPPHDLPRVSRVGDRYVASATGEPAKVYDPSNCVDYSVCVPVATSVATTGTWVESAGTLTSRNGTQLWNLDAATSALRWRSTDPTLDASRTVTADPALDDARAFAPSGSGATAKLAVYDVSGCGSSFCGPQWTVSLPAIATVRPSIAGNIVMVATSDGHLVLAARSGCGSSSCNALRTLNLTGTPSAPPSIVDGRILVPTTAGVETFALPA